VGLKTILDPDGQRDVITAVPFDFVPGERWCYSTALEWAGFLVEHITGVALEDYFQEKIWG